MAQENLSPEFYTILDQSIDAILSGERTIDDCLRAYPKYAALLKPELQIAVLTSKLKSPRLAAESVTGIERRLRKASGNAPKNVINLGLIRLSRAAAAILLAVAIVFAGSGLAVAASANAVPGDALYPVKQARNSALIIAATITGQLDDLWKWLANQRLDEALVLAQRNTLKDENLRDLYKATREAVTRNDPNDPELLDFLWELSAVLDREILVFEDETLEEDLLIIIDPLLSADEDPTREPLPPTFTPTPTETPTLTPTPTESSDELAGNNADLTLTGAVELNAGQNDGNTLTADDLSATLTLTPTVTPTFTPSPRIPPTPTKTLTPLPGATLAPTPTASVTPSLTPLAPPTLINFPTSVLPTATRVPGEFQIDLSVTWYPWTIATRDAFYATRTAEASSP